MRHFQQTIVVAILNRSDNTECRVLNEDRLGPWLIPQSWLEQWWRPHTMLGAIAVELRAYGRVLNTENLTPLRAAFAAATFAVSRGEPNLLLRLAEAAKPSFRLKLNDQIDDFDFAEVVSANNNRSASRDPTNQRLQR